MKLLGVIWNCSYKYKDEILNEIKKRAICILNEDYNIEIGFEDTIREFYNYPLSEEWKTDFKISDLTQAKGRIISIILIDIEPGKKIYIKEKNKVLYENVYNLKKFIRDYFTLIIQKEDPNIYKENIFHLADKESETKRELDLIRRRGIKI